MNNEIISALNWRYAVQAFDPSKKVSDEDLKTILESGRLAPSSIGIEPWKFIVVENAELRSKIKEAGFNQAKIGDASHLVVLARRIDVRQNIANERIERTAKVLQVEPETLDGLRNMLEGSINGMSDEALDRWASEQTYIALGTMVAAAALLKVDCAPVGGFSPEKVDEILGLKERNLASTVILTLGYRGEDPAALRPKVRREYADVVEFVK